jgi:hypothetical protein
LAFCQSRISARTAFVDPHISHIIGLRSERQVFRINAKTIVAFMSNNNAVIAHIIRFWDWSIMDFPRNAMRENLAMATTSDSHCPVA